MRLSQIAKKFNIGTETIIDYLKKQGVKIHNNPNIKLKKEHLSLLEKEFAESLIQKKQAEKLTLETLPQPKQLVKRKNTSEKQPPITPPTPVKQLTILGSIDLTSSFKKKNTEKSKTPSLKPTYTKFRARSPQPFFKKTSFKKPIINKKYKKTRPNKIQEKKDAKEIKEKKILEVTEFITVNELANFMQIPVSKLLTTCMNLGIIASINQRLETETIMILADEFGYQVKFITTESEVQQEIDTPEDLLSRPPVVTIMGHVDHGKTSLLDYIRNTQIAENETGRITQHIGAYKVHTKKNKEIIFLDTPGHQAFTAMRARGVQITDIAIIIIAADDGIMPQTKEAISHAQLANTPIIIAINKIDKPGANPEKIKEQLAQLNITVEDWGGKYQCQEISAKKGIGIDELLEKILLEADMLSLKANPNKKAKGVVIEASLNQGKGYFATTLVQSGTLKEKDTILAGPYFGKIKAMLNDKGIRIKEAKPSTPVQILGLNGAPKAGEKFIVVDNKQIARDIALKNTKIVRNQQLKAQHIASLDQIRKNFDTGVIPEINLIIKGDVDGSIEAIADSLLQLSTEKIKVNIIYKAVGQISESDVILATASKAIIIGFQTKPTPKASSMASEKKIEIKLYKIIYEAIDYIKKYIENALTPTEKQEVVITKAEVIRTFSIPSIGVIAGCKVLKGTIKKEATIQYKRKTKLLYTGGIKELQQKGKNIEQAKNRSECGILLDNFNDILVGDTLEIIQN